MIDWGSAGGLHVFCAVLAWSRFRFRFVRFAADERAATTMGMLAGCLEVLGGAPGKVLADRMGCLKGGVVANVVVPTAEYLRFAAHYGFSELRRSRRSVAVSSEVFVDSFQVLTG